MAAAIKQAINLKSLSLDELFISLRTYVYELEEYILLWQRRCKDAMYSLLTFGVRRPVRHLASVAMAKIIYKEDGISVYARASSL
ncbi:hypothetical protein HN51_016543 [Arachis hypogaea]